VIKAVVRAGKSVLVPLSGSQRYDLVFEDDSGFQRVQCKTGRIEGGAVEFRPVSAANRPPYAREDYRGQVDYFGVWLPESDVVYLVPVDDLGVSKAYLRLAPPRNGQARGIRWAADYLLAEERAAYRVA
jgi:hypothetical protein